MFRRTYFIGLAVLPLLAGCSGSRTLGHAELQTEFRASISLAAESETFLDHLNQHTYSAQFIHGHLAYLEKQGSGIQHDLNNASAQLSDLPALNQLKNSTAELTQTLRNLRSSNPPAYTSSIAALDSIRNQLQADFPR